MLLGVDVGYNDTKDNRGHKFRSSFSLTDKSISGAKKLTIDGKNYYVGMGAMTSEVDKTNTDINMACTIYSFILNGYPKDIHMVAGLPIGQYEEQKNRLIDSIMSYNKRSIYYDDKPYNFKIHDVIVARQGVSSLYTLKDLFGEYIVIDIGGLTVDPCLAEFTCDGAQLIQYDTWYRGIRTLYSSIIEAVNNRFSLKIDVSYAEKILLNGLNIHEKPQDLTFLKPMLQDYIDMLSEEIKLKYPYKTVPIYLTGGGAELLYNAFYKRFESVHKINNPQFANAIGYYNMGYFKFAQRGVVVG